MVRNAPRPRRSSAGFTLVELLVVIGIIALLISILLPALGKARKSAQTVKCLSNLHQMGILMAMYTTQSKGQLPYGYYGGGPTLATAQDYNADYASDWSTLLGYMLGGRFSPVSYGQALQTTGTTAVGAGSRGIFTCPSAQQTATFANIVNHYTANFKLMPSLGRNQELDTGVDFDPRDQNPAGTTYLKSFKVSQLSRSQDLVLIYDGTQSPNGPSDKFAGSFSANAIGANMDNYRRYYDSFLTASYDMINNGSPPYYMNLNAPVDLTPQFGNDFFNKDAYGNDGNFRFRHGDNNGCNVLFADGHCTTMHLTYIPGQVVNTLRTDLLRKNINPDYRPNYELDHPMR